MGSIAASAQRGILGLNQALDQIAISTSRLSSGTRLVRAGDDVGALTQSIQLQSNITSLRQALLNTTQAESFLQTAYNGLSSISDILTEMNAIAVQSSSGSVTAADRAFLEVEFSALSEEIDSIAENTAFNDIALLDGSLSEENYVEGYETAATSAAAYLTFAVNIGAGQTVIINNVTLTEGASFAAGGDINTSLTNLANAINTSTNTALNNVYATSSMGVLTLRDRAGGEIGLTNTVNQTGSTAAFTASADTTARAGTYSFGSGAQNGLTKNSVVHVSGAIGDALVNTMSQTYSTSTFTLSGLPVDNETFSIDNGNGATVDFRFRTAIAVPNTDVQIGSTVAETVQNLIDTINSYTGTNRYNIDQIDFIRDGDSMLMRSKLPGSPKDLVGVAMNVSEAVATGMLSTTTLNNGTNTGVNVSGVTNEEFIGTISGFTATYNSADDITVNVTVGDYTYRAEINDTTPAGNAFVRFISTTTGGGYFDVEQASAGGLAVAAQADANIYASRLNAAFATLDFSQNRIVSSYTGVNDLIGSGFEFQLDDFTSVDLEQVDVSAPASAASSAIIEFRVNGETFRSSSNLGDSISEYEIIEFESLTTTNKLTLRMGNYEVDLSTDALATQFEDDLETSFGLGTGSGGVSFQVGADSSHTLDVSIGSATTDRLFAGENINVLTQSAATTAQTVLEDALNEVNSLLADVGSMQARAQYAAAGLDSEIIAKDEARAALSDTDIAYESTMLALSTVQAQSAIAVIAQTAALASELVSLVKMGA
jgi:flagellin